jgi:hypothetical protein
MVFLGDALRSVTTLMHAGFEVSLSNPEKVTLAINKSP